MKNSVIDHLGNVRAVFMKNGNAANLEGYTDYYPGGMAMPNRNLEDANGYRYGYQGQFAEEDDETGLNAFQLRMYDSRILRWLSPDPYGQFASPYLAMGNNWISYVDQDGGECCKGWNKDAEGNNMLDEVVVSAPSIAKQDFNVPDLAYITLAQKMIQDGARTVFQEGSKQVLKQAATKSLLTAPLLFNGDESSPLSRYPIPDYDDETFIYRRMRIAADGLPQVGPSSSKLGVRSRKYSPQSQNVDIDLYELHGVEYFGFYNDGRLAGMSTTLSTSGGPGSNPIFKIKMKYIYQAGLVPIPDGGDHVTISGGANVTEYTTYITKLNATRAHWSIHSN